MFLGTFQVDDSLTFSANTHTASTGAATDADSVPTYRVYEDETGTAILTGSMAKLDDTNTTGFYSEQLTLSAANGFEAGKSYTVYVSATVGSVVGTMSHSFIVRVKTAVQSDMDTLIASITTSAALAAAVWDRLLTAITTSGSIGKLLKDDIDATISSRNATTPPTVGAIRAEMDANSTKLDATVSRYGNKMQQNKSRSYSTYPTLLPYRG